MRNQFYLSVIILILVITGCIKPEQTEPTPKPEQTEPTPKPKVLLDVPKIVGKTQEEIISILGKPEDITPLNKTDTTGELSLGYNTENANFFINLKNGKANYFHFNSKKGYETLFELGDSVGIDLRNIAPKSSTRAVIDYSGNINGIDWYKIRVVEKSDNGYEIIAFQKSP